MSDQKQQDLSNAIAVVGMSARLPGARGVAEFWRNQLAGVESITHFRADELEVANAAQAVKDPAYVAARPIVADVRSVRCRLLWPVSQGSGDYGPAAPCLP